MATEIEGIKFYNIPEIAQALQVTPQTVRAYIKQGRIKSQRIGRPIFITERNLREFIGLPEYILKDEYLKLDEIQRAYYVKATLGGESFYTAKDRASQIKNLQEKIRANK